MHKNIKVYNYKLQYLLFLSLSTQLYSLPYQDTFQVGLGYDTNKSTVLPSPFQNIEIQSKKINQKTTEKIVQIKNLNDLFHAMEIEQSLQTLKSRKIDKLLNNPNINDYTLTYLLYSRVTTVKNFLKIAEKQDIKTCKNYINSIQIGGEDIMLIHIKTTSKNDYKKVEKYINKQKLSWQHIDTFIKKIDKLSDSHMVTLRNIIIADQTLLPADDLKSAVKDIKVFKNSIISHAIPYKANIVKCDKKEQIIAPYLKAKQSLHNLNYIRKHGNQFDRNIQPEQKEQLKSYLLKIERDKNEYNTTKLTNMIKNISYPKRYQALINKPIEIDKITLPSNKIKKRYPKIVEDKIVSLQYDFKLKIQNSGKTIILTWVKTVKVGEELVHKEKNSKILLDSYVNFKGLKAKQINSYNIGSLNYKTPFNAYAKNKKIEGFGIIKDANCSYEIDNNSILNIECKDIKLKDLDIKFKHEEQ